MRGDGEVSGMEMNDLKPTKTIKKWDLVEEN